MTLDELNQLSQEQAAEQLALCCGSRRWATQMAQGRPFASEQELFELAESIWWDLDEEDWLEAFSHHPKIGGVDKLREKFASTRSWADGEQKGVAQATEDVLERLARGNDLYEERFGYIFIVCATGKSAEEMLSLLEERIDNDAADELRIAAGEQNKITRIRLKKLLA